VQQCEQLLRLAQWMQQPSTRTALSTTCGWLGGALVAGV
jgi:hypothetical protein